MTTVKHKRIYNYASALIEKNPLSRGELIDRIYEKLTSTSPIKGECTVGCASSIRAEIGNTLNEMETAGLIENGKGGYRLIAKRPAILRSESLEREIVTILRYSKKTKAELKAELETIYGTKETPTGRDDNILSTLLGNLLKRLISLGIIVVTDGYYSISPKKEAKIDDIHSILSLREDFVIRLHTKGGEYFEHYFMTLLEKYMQKHGKTVVESKVNGGAADGGIDGIMKTTDSLGFKELIMVQMKNRLEETNETAVRGFWGSVCAYQGTRGIFATTSSFHPLAKEFLDNIDNCIGLDGEAIFKMALECQYGVKKKGGRYALDTKII